jgi:hypothetical protein
MVGKLQRVIYAGAAFGLALAAAPVAARADVTVERYLKTGGIAGFGASEGSTVEKLSGLRKRETSSMKMSGFLGKVAGDLGSDSITDIPKDAVWRIDHKKKSYTESRITPPPATEEKADKGERRSEKEEKRNVRVVRSEITVKETGETKTIGAYSCTHYVVTWVLETEDLDTHDRSENTMITDLWNAAETAELKDMQKEEKAFTEAYLKKIGWDMSNQDMRTMGVAAVAGMFGADQEALKKGVAEVAEKMKKVKGFPIGVGVRWQIKGTASAKSAKSGKGGESSKGGGESQGMPDLSKSLGGLMAALGGKKGGDSGQAAGGSGDSGASGASGASTVFDTYTEIRKVTTGGVPGEELAPPAGYTKADSK